jgi:paraquat-inducible protein B
MGGQIMKNSFWIFAALIISIIALIVSLNSLSATAGFQKIKTTLLQLEFKMETKKYLLEAKAHLLEAKALFNFNKNLAAAQTEIKQAEQFLGMALLTANENENKKIAEINDELIRLEQIISKGQKLGPNFIDRAQALLDKFFGLVKK